MYHEPLVECMLTRCNTPKSISLSGHSAIKASQPSRSFMPKQWARPLSPSFTLQQRPMPVHSLVLTSDNDAHVETRQGLIQNEPHAYTSGSGLREIAEEQSSASSSLYSCECKGEVKRKIRSNFLLRTDVVYLVGFFVYNLISILHISTTLPFLSFISSSVIMMRIRELRLNLKNLLFIFLFMFKWVGL